MLKKQKKLLLPPSYLHQQDDRSENQRHLSTMLTRALTQINLKRIGQYYQKHGSPKINQDLFHFICIQGLPPMEGQFQNIDLPGTKTILSMIGIKGQYSQEQYMKIFYEEDFETESKRIREIVEKVPKNKKIIFTYHSFGTYHTLAYLKIYEKDHRISGIIDLGGAPIRYYPVLKNIMKNMIHVNLDVAVENKQIVFKEYVQGMKDSEVNSFSNPNHVVIFIKFAKSKYFQTMFEINRHLPECLKLFMFGRKDSLFLEDLLAEKVVYYNYKNKIPEQLEKKYQKGFKQLYNCQATNIQQRFGFNMEKGKHSLHMQKKTNKEINLAIKQYLSVLSYGFD